MRALVIVSLLVAAGCGTSPEEKKPAGPPFALDAPSSLELLNGQSIKQDVAVKWEKGEREDLDISASVTPESGVSASVEPARLTRGAGPAQVTVTASETAAAGDYKVTVTAKGVKSGEAKATMTVKVPRKE
jgi:aminopeptidase S